MQKKTNSKSTIITFMRSRGHYCWLSVWPPRSLEDPLWPNGLHPHYQYYSIQFCQVNWNWKNRDIVEVRSNWRPRRTASKTDLRTGIVFQWLDRFRSGFWEVVWQGVSPARVPFGYFWLSLIRPLQRWICFLVFSILFGDFGTKFWPEIMILKLESTNIRTQL